MIKTQMFFTTLTFAMLVSTNLTSEPAEEKKPEESEYANLSKEIRKVASDIEDMVYYHRYKTKSKEKKLLQDERLNDISRLVETLQNITLITVNKLKSQRKIITADPISFNDTSYKLLARSVRKIASNVDKIVSDFETSDKKSATMLNNSLTKIAALTSRLHRITIRIVTEINNSNGSNFTCPPLLEAGSSDAGIDLEKEGKQHAKDHSKNNFISCDFKRASTW